MEVRFVENDLSEHEREELKTDFNFTTIDECYALIAVTPKEWQTMENVFDLSPEDESVES